MQAGCQGFDSLQLHSIFSGFRRTRRGLIAHPSHIAGGRNEATLFGITLTTGDWIQIGGLAVNAGLLIGLIFELWRSSSSRDEDLREAKKRATLEAWQTLDDSIRAAERESYTYFGRHRVTSERAKEFDKLVTSVNQDRHPADEPPDERETSIMHVNESMRSLLNSVDTFLIGVESDAYDAEIAGQLAGWRLCGVFVRYLGFIEIIREDIGSQDPWSRLEHYAKQFLAANDAADQPRWRDIFTPQADEQAHPQ